MPVLNAENGAPRHEAFPGSPIDSRTTATSPSVQRVPKVSSHQKIPPHLWVERAWGLHCGVHKSGAVDGLGSGVTRPGHWHLGTCAEQISTRIPSYSTHRGPWVCSCGGFFRCSWAALEKGQQSRTLPAHVFASLLFIKHRITLSRPTTVEANLLEQDSVKPAKLGDDSCDTQTSSHTQLPPCHGFTPSTNLDQRDGAKTFSTYVQQFPYLSSNKLVSDTFYPQNTTHPHPLACHHQGRCLQLLVSTSLTSLTATSHNTVCFHSLSSHLIPRGMGSHTLPRSYYVHRSADSTHILVPTHTAPRRRRGQISEREIETYQQWRIDISTHL